MTCVFVNGRVLTDDGFADGLAVLVDGERITAVVPADDARVRGAARHDLAGRLLVPGFVDCQVNGGGGVLFNDDPAVDTIRRIGAAHRAFGTTGFLPTLISDDLDVMRAAVAAVEAAIDQDVPGVLGLHFEGPFLSPQRRGVHDAAKFRVPDEESLGIVCSLRRGVTLVTLAPECVPADTVAMLARRGIIVSAGHTAASYEAVRAALDAGLRGFTHLFNAISPFTSREPGAVGAALEDPHAWCGLIADGFHVHPASMRLALRAKPRGKVILVTDAMPPVGSDVREFTLRGERITCEGGRCATAGGVLAGSALDMAAAVRNMVRLAGVAPDEAVRMASLYPAAFLGLDGSLGRIAAGSRADLVALNQDLTVHAVWIGGVSAES